MRTILFLMILAAVAQAQSAGAPGAVQAAGTGGTFADSGCTGVAGLLTCPSVHGGDVSHAGFAAFGQGTAPTGIPSNSVYFYGASSIPTGFGWRLPSADAAGALSSNGSGVMNLTAFQGTDSRIVTGSFGAGVGIYPCTDSNGGLGTTGCPVFSDPTVPSQYWLLESFPTTRPDALSSQSVYLGNIAWFEFGGGSFASAPALAGLPGIFNVSTTTTSGNSSGITLGYGGASQFNTLGASTAFSTWVSRNIVVLNPAAGTVPLATTGYYFCLASGDADYLSCGSFAIAADTTSQTGVFCFTTGTWSTANWNYISNGTCFDSGVPVNSNFKYKLIMNSTAPGTVVYTVNDAAAHTFSSGVYDMAVSPEMVVVTRAAASKTASENHFSFYGNGLTR
jgi:hypothetical protein